MADAHAASSAPHEHLLEFVMDFWKCNLVFHAAQMGIADLVGDEPVQIYEFAENHGYHGPALRRYFRALAGLGLFKHIGNNHFQITEIGSALRTGAAGSARATILTQSGEFLGASFGDINHSLRTGEPSFEKQHGKGVFEFIEENPEWAELFSESMVGIHGAEPGAVADAYDFSEFSTLVDVGGATGNMLGHVLRKFTQLKGVLFDRPHVVADAPPLLERFGVSERVSIEMGSFFDSVPVGHDAYLMSHIVHDWDESEIAQILENCRRPMRSDSRLLIVEMVLPEGDEPHPGKLIDICMLLAPGGQERTASEYDELLAKNGFKMTRVVPTASAVSIVEAVIA